MCCPFSSPPRPPSPRGACTSPIFPPPTGRSMGSFDVVLMANLLCRLPTPKTCLARLGGPNALVQPGGHVVLTSPFSWLEQFTDKENWMGGTAEQCVGILTICPLFICLCLWERIVRRVAGAHSVCPMHLRVGARMGRGVHLLTAMPARLLLAHICTCPVQRSSRDALVEFMEANGEFKCVPRADHRSSPARALPNTTPTLMHTRYPIVYSLRLH